MFEHVISEYKHGKQENKDNNLDIAAQTPAWQRPVNTSNTTVQKL